MLLVEKQKAEQLGWKSVFGPVIEPEEPATERGDFLTGFLARRFCDALKRLKPSESHMFMEEASQIRTRLDCPILLSTERFSKLAGRSRIRSELLLVGTVLISSKAPMDYIVVAQTPVAINHGIIVLQPSGDPGSLFPLHWCAARMGAINERANGQALMEIGKSNVRQLVAVVSDHQVTYSYSRHAKPLSKQTRWNSIPSEKLSTLRDNLLPEFQSDKTSKGQSLTEQPL